VAENGPSAKDRIILPLDFNSVPDAVNAVVELKDHVGLFKIGLTLFMIGGLGIIKQIYEEAGQAVFLDLKFHDIPETVARASAVLMDTETHAVKFITVHASEGEARLSAAVRSMKNGTTVLAITVLTSSTEIEIQKIYNMSVRERVMELAQVARRADCGGVVCSGHEANEVKQRFGKDFIVVTPGIRPRWADVPGDDQRRIMTPGDAIKAGSDYVVVGRPIYTAPTRAARIDAAKRVASEIEQGLAARSK
jgi:orotidine-5'-phosphate decarboxylase